MIQTEKTAQLETVKKVDAASQAKPADHREIPTSDATSRSGAPSTSGRSAEEERPVTFRSLGVSEWLDR